MKVDYIPEQGEVGPFPGSVKPSKTGLYKRISKKGNVVYAYFNAGGYGRWGMFSSRVRNAIRKANKPSKHQQLPWIGLDAHTYGVRPKLDR